MHRIAQRDPSGLDALYHRHAVSVYSLALSILHDVQEAEELTTAVFARAWATGSGFDVGRGRVGPWLQVITRCRANAMVRDRRACLPSSDEPVPPVQLDIRHLRAMRRE